MTTPFWCLLVAVILPYVWATFAAVLRKKQFGDALDNHAPRSQDPKLEARASRAYGAHLNSFEALAYFAPAVIVASLAHADETWVARIAIGFIVCRVLHGVMYLADKPPLRTMFFAFGLLGSIALFVLAARA